MLYARQFDTPEMGVVTSDDFGNADILYDQTLSKVGALQQRVVFICIDGLLQRCLGIKTGLFTLVKLVGAAGFIVMPC
jgi:hypothetical protein